MTKRLLIFVLTVVIIIGTFGITACNVDTGGTGDAELMEYKTTAKADLDNYAKAKGEENYSEENWQIILELVNVGKSVIDSAIDKIQVDSAIIYSQNEIEAVPIRRGIMDDFSLVISTEITTVTKRQDITIDIMLKNISSNSYEIAYFFLFYVVCPTATSIADKELPQEPQFITLEKDMAIQYSESLFSEVELPVGTHEVSYDARFYLYYGQPSEKSINIKSNIIPITLLAN